MAEATLSQAATTTPSPPSLISEMLASASLAPPFDDTFLSPSATYASLADVIPSSTDPASPPLAVPKPGLSRSKTEPNLKRIGALREGTRTVTASSDPEVARTTSGAGSRPVARKQGAEGEVTGGRRAPLELFKMYETKNKLYVIASNQALTQFRVLKIDRSLPPPLRPKRKEGESPDEEAGVNVTEDEGVYTEEGIIELKKMLEAGNVGWTQVQTVGKTGNPFFGIAGFVRFTSTYYMIMITQRSTVALIGGHYIHHCGKVALFPISQVSGTKSSEEARLYSAFHGVDMSSHFYFSYTYDLTHTLQYNLTRPVPDLATPGDAFATFNDKWLWNRHLLNPAFQSYVGKSAWVLPMIHGFINQTKLSVFGKVIYITLIARRSRHFAGARFLKRGINEQGYVANDVETEQIVSDALTTSFWSPPRAGEPLGRRQANSRYTSFVQVRGSIPLYWCQEAVNMAPKPPIELTVIDPYFSAAALHFDDLLGRYGGPITVINLIKQKERAPRESKLLGEFKQCIDYLNQFLPPTQTIKYIPWDIAAANKQRHKDVIGILEDIAEESIESTNFFHSGAEPTWHQQNPDPDAPPYRSTPLLQSGVTRTNCIDCLDRTNAAQFVIAKAALGHQLHALGVIHHPSLPFDSDAVNLITTMFHDHGDTIALQYGGSHLVNTMETYRAKAQWSNNSRETLENLRRYYTNSFVDADKQAAIDLFLGVESTTPSPQIPTPRRSYREWFTLSNLDPPPEPAEVSTTIALAQAMEEGESHWDFYYRPSLRSTLGKLFARTIPGSATEEFGTREEGMDHSPFVPRLTPAAPVNRLNVGGVRRWMSHRTPNKTTLRTRIQSQRIDESTPLEGPTPLSTTEAIVQRSLNPVVDADEAKEYDLYIDQFERLSLSQDPLSLSEKDRLLYVCHAEVRVGVVDKGSRNVYSEAVRTSRPGQSLGGGSVVD